MIDTSSAFENTPLKPNATTFERPFDFGAHFNMSYIKKQFFVHQVK
jgi:hypothetical protein